jgi:DNA-binding transcriptional LysR family regulator
MALSLLLGRYVYLSLKLDLIAITIFYAVMDIRLLEAFRAVLETGSVTHAAAALGVTQPAVSAQIGRLEAVLGFSLFERSSNRLRPTSEAIAFRAEVDRTLGRIDDLTSAAALMRDGLAGTLAIASHPMAGVTLLPPVVASFIRKRPNVRIKLLTRNSDVVREMFPSRMQDIGICEQPIDPKGLVVARYRLECVAVLPKDHALCAHEVITPEHLSGLPFIAMFREWSVHHQVAAVFAQAGAHLNIAVSSELFAMMCGLVANGAGVSVVDPATAAQFQIMGLEIRKFRPVVPYDIAVFHSAERSISRIGQAFLTAFDARLRTFSDPT